MNCESAPLGPLDKAPVQIDIVAALLGLDTANYSIGHLAGWSHGDTDVNKSTGGNVLRAAHTIADGICTD